MSSLEHLVIGADKYTIGSSRTNIKNFRNASSKIKSVEIEDL